MAVASGRVEQVDDAYWDEVATRADSLPDGWRRHARRTHVELIHRWVGEPSGRWLKTDLYEERDAVRALLPALPTASWVGVDLAAETVRRAGTPAAVAADVRRLPFADGTFDGVLSTSTLDHFDEVASLHAALTELRRVIATGGCLVLTLDNPGNPLIRLRNALPHRVARRTGLVPFAVGRTLGLDEGRAALVGHGFDVVDTALLLHAPHVVGTRLARFGPWERHALPRLDRLGRRPVGRTTAHFVAFLARAS